MDKTQELEQKLRLVNIRLERTKEAAYYAMLRITAYMGIPEAKRLEWIKEEMDNLIYSADNNLPQDLENK